MTVAAELAKAGLATALALGLSEGVVRALTSGIRPELDCYTQTGEVVQFRPACTRELNGPGGRWSVAFGADGFRDRPEGVGGAKVLVVGDSQALGMYLPGHQTLGPALRARGVAARVLGVPGYGVLDAMALADREAGRATVVLLVNAANDWDEPTAVNTRYAVRGGYLVTATHADGWMAGTLATPARHSMFVVWGIASLASPPASVVSDPAPVLAALRHAAGAGIGIAYLPFAGRPELPADLLHLRLDPTLGADDGRLPGDPHLSAAGVARVAEQLVAWL